ncbi:uncharacterized protein MYCGRDRAFT_97774 [Zymoseptoria tritici IPO323]|uniref:Uncharacterized protein n=1 Tax=Zymoseptoria tritici (strain CBS 115943 / IPO323) TaxID=336722 RepID=F9XRC0_ZYMTI|nr:uncharacterized protein MYCGRDRAFT_97774 [Zymoseptoria tritici IPO323]EGP82233.1 hypothetical protein MYCGRDRAFT_97774 [Zymoseptoria tritici IPO323]
MANIAVKRGHLPLLNRIQQLKASPLPFPPLPPGGTNQQQLESSRPNQGQVVLEYDDSPSRTWRKQSPCLSRISPVSLSSESSSSTSDLHTYHSTASSPSLRSRDAVDMERPLTPIDSDGDNGKVVIRVRRFIKRDFEKQSLCIIRMNPVTQD